jgi:hypothetical protein
MGEGSPDIGKVGYVEVRCCLGLPKVQVVAGQLDQYNKVREIGPLFSSEE